MPKSSQEASVGRTVGVTWSKRQASGCGSESSCRALGEMSTGSSKRKEALGD